jgi:hypothetical protein
VRVLLGLGDVQLQAAVRGDHARQRHLRAGRRERNRTVAVLASVLRQRRIAGDRLGAVAVDAGAVRIGQRAGELAHAVGTEVERDHGVAGADRALVADARRRDELVGLTAIVGRQDRGAGGRRGMRGEPVRDQVVGLLDALPAAVAVHREIASDDARDAPHALLRAPALDRSDELRARRRQRVATVGEGVDDQVLHAGLRGHLQQPVDVRDARVHAAV